MTGRADEALGLLDDYASSTDDAFTTLVDSGEYRKVLDKWGVGSNDITKTS